MAKTKEQLQTEADAEIESAKPMYKQVNNERMEFEDSDYAQAKIDLGNSKWEAQQFILGLLIIPMVALYARSPHIRTQI